MPKHAEKKQLYAGITQFVSTQQLYMIYIIKSKIIFIS